MIKSGNEAGTLGAVVGAFRFVRAARSEWEREGALGRVAPTISGFLIAYFGSGPFGIRKNPNFFTPLISVSYARLSLFSRRAATASPLLTNAISPGSLLSSLLFSRRRDSFSLRRRRRRRQLLSSHAISPVCRLGKGLNTEQNKMQQRKSAFGRPSGTDGSDYSYRMVVDSRYQLVAKGKKRLAVLFIIEAVFLLIGAVFAFLPGTKADTPNAVAFYSVIASVVLLIIADIGRRRSRPSLLRLYAVLSSLAMLLFTVSLANQYSLLKAIQYISSRGAKKFDANEFPSFQIGFLVYILTLSVFKISTIKAVVFLLFNMTPPKKAS